MEKFGNLVNIEDIGGDLIKSDDKYELYDNKLLKNLVLSKTKLRANKSTNGHRHAGQEEVYYFISGKGKMELDYRMFDVKAGDVVLVEDNVFHKVHNTGDFWLEFICVFDGRRNH
jgi:mannose-6-phosphate isomerase-like protein (cupin superfamily)